MRRRIAAVAIAVAVSLTAAACADDGDLAEESDGAGQTSAPATTENGSDTDTGDPGTESPDDTQDGTTTVVSNPNGPASTTPSTSSAPPTTASPAIDGTVPVGQFAPSVLRPDVSQRLVIEVQADQAPNQSTLDHVRATLGDVSGKPVDLVAGAAPGGGDRDWDAAALQETADRGAAVPQGNGTAVLRILFVHGSFEGDDGTLGVAVRGDVAAIFVDQVASAAGVIGSVAAIERSVTTHELGHLLGLVDLYLDTGRDDPDHPGHSTNRNSVMFWAVESDVIGQLLGANPPDSFDAADRADLDAIRHGA